VKNHCPELGKQAADHKLAWVSYVVGKRESRRLIGDYVLTENDIARQTLPADRVAYSAWCLDDHYSEGFFYNGRPRTALIAACRTACPTGACIPRISRTC